MFLSVSALASGLHSVSRTDVTHLLVPWGTLLLEEAGRLPPVKFKRYQDVEESTSVQGQCQVPRAAVVRQVSFNWRS